MDENAGLRPADSTSRSGPWCNCGEIGSEIMWARGLLHLIYTSTQRKRRPNAYCRPEPEV